MRRTKIATRHGGGFVTQDADLSDWFSENTRRRSHGLGPGSIGAIPLANMVGARSGLDGTGPGRAGDRTRYPGGDLPSNFHAMLSRMARRA